VVLLPAPEEVSPEPLATTSGFILPSSVGPKLLLLLSTTSEALVLGKKLWSIPVKGQFEQIENDKRLKNMSVYTDELTFKNLNIWLDNYQKIEYNWINPIKNIIDKINGNY
jgi:hypothetical protein